MDLFYKGGVSILSFLIILLVSKIVSKNDKFKFLENRSNRFTTLDGLRGYLAISVYYTHYLITWYWINTGSWQMPSETCYRNYGKVGVALFFMLTGFLFIGKLIKHSEGINWIKLFESRIFRIIPLYLLSVGLITFLVFSKTNFEVQVKDSELFNEYLKWFLYHGGTINDFSDTRKINAGVDWTLKYEWLFYISLPAIYLILYKSLLMIKLSLLFLPMLFYFWPVSFLSFNSKFVILFMLGGLTSIIYKYFQIPASILKNNYVSTLTMILSILSIIYPRPYSFMHIIILSLFFILVAYGNDMFGLFSTRASLLLGEISYSIYLLHGIIVYVVFSYIQLINVSSLSIYTYLLLMPLVGALVVVLCSVTYLYIEKPSIQIGKKYFLTHLIMRTPNFYQDVMSKGRNGVVRSPTKK